MPAQQTNITRHNTLILFAILIAIAIVVIATATATSASAPSKLPSQAGPVSTTNTPSPTPAGCIEMWRRVDSPSPYTTGDNALNGLAAVSSTDVWAVGDNVIEHWDGSVWTAMTSTLPLTSSTYLYSAAAGSANDVWAVGRGDGVDHTTGVILHWDGSDWSNIPNPDPQDETAFFGVTAISANDVWAVGYRNDVSVSSALAMHWDGSAWTIVPTPDPPSGDAYKLFDVSALSSDDVWAAGWSNSATLVMHWDGTAWTISPTSTSFQGEIVGIVAISDNDVWASGSFLSGGVYAGFILHWDGTSWSLSTTRAGRIMRIAATSANDVWAVGAGDHTLVMHWDGAAWTEMNTPRPYPFAGELFGVVAIAPDDVWAVGDAAIDNENGSLTVQYRQWCQPPIACTPGWSIVQGPNPGPDTNFLYGIDGVSADDIWTVGAFNLSNGGTYAQHWNGSYWTPVFIPDVPNGTALRAVKAISSNNVWAVGDSDESAVGEQSAGARKASNHRPGDPLDSPSLGNLTVIVHWDGQVWTRIPSPNPGNDTLGNLLYGIDGTSANDLWAVGTYEVSGQDRTLILHWDGSTWTQVASPVGNLFGVAALSANDVWAVGDSGPYSTSTTLTLHWDGWTWTAVASPNLGTGNTLSGISAVSSNDIWAVGYSYQATAANTSIIMHWDGTQWSLVSAPFNSDLEGVSARASNDVWAVGNNSNSWQAPILHWDGSAWTLVQHPMPPPNQLSELYGVLAVSSNEVWAVGDVGQYYIQTDIERYVGSCATPVVTQTPVSTPSPVPTGCVLTWTVANSPNPGDYNELIDVAANSANDIWAVGDTIQQAGFNRYPLIEHWDGTAWSVVTPTEVLTDSTLYSVATIASNDAWAVGTTTTDSHPVALIVHWDGNEWHSVPNPGPPSFSSLSGISAISANDIWAAGNPGLMHWDGSSWTLVQVSGIVNFDKVAAVSSDDVWAAGEVNNSIAMVHWDGNQWTVASGTFQGFTYGMAAVSTNDVWAVNMYYDNTGQRDWILHWDGTSWSVSSQDEGYRLFGISATSANDAWAVGDNGITNTAPFAKHWDGISWTVVSTTNLPSDGDLLAASAISSAELWAVGRQDDGNNTLTAHYAYTCPTATITPSRTPSPTATRTATPSGSQTATTTNTPTSITTVAATSATAATRTSTTTATASRTASPGSTATTGVPASRTVAPATATPTSCTMQFEDVPPGNTFYAGVHCLACRGIVSGYACGGQGEPCDPAHDPYFRPGNSVTRGQLAKIVSQAAGFSEPVSGQTFEDVPPGSTFYTYTERLASRGVMSGYPCGGPGEPCHANRPYFRPNSTATRGQLTKIESNAAGFTDNIPPGQQTFTDVSPDSTFYLYVERLLMNRPRVMSGYPCGGPGEPCDSRHRPYFRPGNTLTRGQTAKITANTFLPDCVP